MWVTTAPVRAQFEYPFQNPDLPIEERVNNVISLMTLEEKVAFLSSRPGVPRLGIRAVGHVEGLHGLAMGGPGNWGRRNPAPTTMFPQAIGMAETWDTDLIHQAGAIEGYEVRYMFQSEKYGRGALVVLRDHINLQGQNPLMGPNDERLGLRHPDMTEAYNSQFRQFVREETERLGGGVFEGVYAAVSGPNFETPAEIRFLRTIGADLVGMSTVLEVIAARHMGIEVLAISCVTNMAAGMTGEKITAEEVLETGERLSGKFLALLRAVLPRIDGYLESH